VRPRSRRWVLHDAARLSAAWALAFTTDSVWCGPWFFPGGDIGRLRWIARQRPGDGGRMPWPSAWLWILEEGLAMACFAHSGAIRKVGAEWRRSGGDRRHKGGGSGATGMAFSSPPSAVGRLGRSPPRPTCGSSSVTAILGVAILGRPRGGDPAARQEAGFRTDLQK